jgi:fusion and transport protein UGO1
VRLPLETVLRRGQVQVLASPTYLGNGSELDTIVDVGQYRGTIGTMWLIAREEGSSASHAQSGQRGKKSEKSGQGMEGLFRGWRVGMWGLVGMWGAAAMGGIGGSGGEF